MIFAEHAPLPHLLHDYPITVLLLTLSHHNDSDN